MDADEDDPLVVDVRDEHSFGHAHVPGSENVPFAEIPKESDRIAAADHVVTVCYEGLASAKAARLIASHKDFDGVVENLADGMEAWEGPVDGEAEVDTGADVSEQPDAPF